MDRSDRTASETGERQRSAAGQRGLNRVIAMTAVEGEVRAALEDDFHHFRVRLRHDRERVTGISSEAPRQPYSLCGSAGHRLDTLIGERLVQDTTTFFQHHDVLLQCTHQFDLATLAIASAARGTTARRYHAFVGDSKSAGGEREARLWRDGELLLDWTFENGVILAPSGNAGQQLGRGFTAWAGTRLDPESAEAALVLRRAIFISSGRGHKEKLDREDHAAPRGGCWVQQPERAAEARRQKGSTIDFSGRSNLLTAADDDWLAYREAQP